jgi:hypothetical protein
MTTLPNGIVLPADWPPRLEMPPNYHADAPMRVYHRPAKYPGNPVFFPQTEWECNDRQPPGTVPKCGGLWYDERDRQFKMWYMASYLGAMAYATSADARGESGGYRGAGEITA